MCGMDVIVLAIASTKTKQIKGCSSTIHKSWFPILRASWVPRAKNLFLLAGLVSRLFLVSMFELTLGHLVLLKQVPLLFRVQVYGILDGILWLCRSLIGIIHLTFLVHSRLFIIYAWRLILDACLVPDAWCLMHAWWFMAHGSRHVG